MLLGKSSRLVIPIAALVAIVVLAAFAKLPQAISSTSLTKTYANAAYGFALNMPAEFSAYPPNATPARDASGALTGEAIVLQSKTATRYKLTSL